MVTILLTAGKPDESFLVLLIESVHISFGIAIADVGIRFAIVSELVPCDHTVFVRVAQSEKHDKLGFDVVFVFLGVHLRHINNLSTFGGNQLKRH